MSLFKDLMNFDCRITCTMLGLDPNTHPQNILPLSNADSPAGLKDPHSNYVFYLVQFDDADINRQIDDITIENSNPALTTKRIQYVRNLRFIWQIYGDDGFEWADTIRIMLFDNDIKALFAEKGISLITDVPEPVYFPEKISQHWYKRNDLSAKFNQLVTRESAVPAVSGTDIILEDEKGVVGTCSVSGQ